MDIQPPSSPYTPIQIGVVKESNIMLLSQIGEGSYGTVFKARDNSVRRMVAVKIVDPPNVQAGAMKEICEEWDFLQALGQHPNITSLHAAFTLNSLTAQFDFQPNSIALVMELMDSSLADVMASAGPIPAIYLPLICGSVLMAMQYLKVNKIAHRDIKPSNILCLHSSGVVKLADFGEAKQMNKTLMTTTSTGAICYRAPEKLRGDPFTDKAEVWSFGIAITELASGAFPIPHIKKTHWMEIFNVRADQLPDDSSPTTRINNRSEYLLDYIESKGPPTLPLCIFPSKLVDFLARTLQVESESRAGLQDLIGHPFISSDPPRARQEAFATWLCSIMERDPKPGEEKKNKLKAEAAEQAAMCNSECPLTFVVILLADESWPIDMWQVVLRRADCTFAALREKLTRIIGKEECHFTTVEGDRISDSLDVSTFLREYSGAMVIVMRGR